MTQSIGGRAVWCATPFKSLRHNNSQRHHGYECEAVIIFYRYLIHVAKTAIAFWIEIFGLKKAPEKRPGCFFIQRVVFECVAIIF